jgi:hypothetical protein
MRKALLLALLAVSTAAAGEAAPANKDRVERYFEGWYSFCPGTKVAVSDAPEIRLPGYEAYKVERSCELKNRTEMNVTLVDPAKNEIFVGDVLFDGSRKDRPFSPVSDTPMIEGALKQAFGVPATLKLEPASRGPLLPIRVSLQQAPNASAKFSGYVSQDGAALLIGEFRPLDVPPDVYRERILGESHGVRPPKGNFFVTAFIDFQCERCRKRTPEVRDFVWSRGGALEIRFLPLVKVHDWSFAAAECAAALSNISPALYAKYEDAVFPRAGSFDAAAARQVAADVADAAGARAAYDAELSSGRARDRVVRDIEVALRLGLVGTPTFFYRGTFITSEDGLAEKAIERRQGGSSGAPAR